MSTCAGCGGVIGRDCFNPQECEAITRDMAARYEAQQERDEESPDELYMTVRRLIRTHGTDTLRGVITMIEQEPSDE